MLQLIAGKRIDEVHSQKLFNLIEKRYNLDGLSTNERIERKDQIEESINKMISTTANRIMTDEVQMDKMIELLAEFKLLNNLEIPKNMTDFFLMQMICKNSALRQNIEKYQNFAERIIEEYAYNDLDDMIKERNSNCKYCYFIRDVLDDDENTQGFFSK